MMRPKPWLEKHPQTLTLIGCLTVQTTFFFPGKFQTNPLTEFKRMVVSTEKIICSQLVALWSWAHFNRFFRWPSVSTGFHKGWLYILLLLRSSVVALFSRWSWLLSYLFDSWCLGLWRMFVVRRAKQFVDPVFGLLHVVDKTDLKRSNLLTASIVSANILLSSHHSELLLPQPYD